MAYLMTQIQKAKYWEILKIETRWKGTRTLNIKGMFYAKSKEMPEICVETLKISYSPRVMTHSFTKFSHIAQFMVSMISFFSHTSILSEEEE